MLEKGTGGCLTLIVLQDVGGEASLVSHIGSVLTVLRLDHIFQVVIDLNEHNNYK